MNIGEEVFDLNVVLEERFHWLLPGDCCLDQIFLFAIADNLQKKGNENRKMAKTHFSKGKTHLKYFKNYCSLPL